MRTWVSALSFAAIAAAGPGCLLPSGPKADLVVRGGKIVTMSAERPVAEALAVVGERIRAVGRGAEIEAWVGPETRIIELDGAIAIPGWIDAHGHWLEIGLDRMRLDLTGTESPEEIAERVRAAAERTEEGAWILGRGWDPTRWPPNARATAEALDRVSPGHPVYLVSQDGRAGWANSRALEIAGIDEGATDPEGGEMVRDRQGRPTGVLRDRARELVTRHLPEPTESDRWTAFFVAQQAALEAGITSFQDAGVGREEVELYRRARDEGRLRVRLYAMLDGRDAALLESFFSHRPDVSPYLTLRAVKLTADGSLATWQAALLEDYADRPHERGVLTLTAEDIYALASRALNAGYQVSVDATGDRAVRVALDGFARALAERAFARPPRFRIEHAKVLHPADVARFAELGVTASMQTAHATYEMPWMAERLGEERARERAHVWQSLLRSGARIAGGSDAPRESLSPLASFYAAITRQDRDGNPAGGWHPDQRMSREQALRASTLDAAYAAFEEDEKGSLEPGKLADLTVLSEDIMTIEPEAILDAQVLYTIVGGKVAFEKEMSESRLRPAER